MNKNLKPVLMRCLLLGIVLLGSRPALAQVSQAGGIVLSFDPSVRATGMGGAANAVFWGQNPDYWANPALLGYHSGIRLHQGKTQLVPDLADDVFFTTQRFSFAAWGLGVAFSGKPFGETFLDQGTQTATGSSNEFLGEFQSYQDVESLSLGFSFGRFATHFTESHGRQIAWLHLADLAVGYSRKSVVDQLAPDWVARGGVSGTGEVTTQDRGIFVRLTPINTMNEVAAELFPAALQDIGAQLDFAFGYSIQNFDDKMIRFGSAGQSDPIARVPRRGFAGRVALGGMSLFEGTERETLGRLITPLVSVGFAKDSFDETVLISDERITYSEVEEEGYEITVLNILSWRRGQYDDPAGQVIGDTSGWSVGLEFGAIGGLRYDRATRPQSTGLAEVDREAFTIYFDPLEYLAWRREG